MREVGKQDYEANIIDKADEMALAGKEGCSLCVKLDLGN